jgi:D-alanyl-D-alanine-carboxypeptidase/D-alanyl-D-alanine-endopeptidase
MKKIVLVFTMLIQLSDMTFSQTGQKEKQKMDTIVGKAAQTFIKGKSWIAFSSGVIKNGDTYIYNYGSTEKDKNKVPSDHTLYEIGSVTKTCTSLLLAQAVLEKRVKPDDDIRKYLQGNYPNLEYAGKPIQLIHLVNLTSGLPDNMPKSPGAFKNMNEDSIPFAFVKLHAAYTKTNFLKDLHQVKLDTVPGLFPGHSNAAALLLTFILENIYQTPYQELLKKYITQPLKIDETFITVPKNKVKLLAKGYNEKGLLMPYVPDNETMLKSTIADMTKYMQFQLEEKNPAVKMTHKIEWGDVNSFSLGMNWFINKTTDEKLKIRDDGTTFGFTTYILMYPEQKFGVVLMANTYSPTSNNDLGKIAEEIFERNYFTVAERSSDAFRFSPSVNMLLSQLKKEGFDRAIEAANELKKNNPQFHLKENEVNSWGYFLSGKNEDAKALEIFKMNVALYPDSWNVYDSYGEMLLKTGQKEEAIKMYKKSLELNPKNENGKKVLEEIIKQ